MAMMNRDREQLRALHALVFDFDGTLATCPYDFTRMRQAVLETVTAFGLDPARLGPRAGLLETIDTGARLLAVDPAQAEAFRIAATESLSALEYEAAARTELLPGVVAALHALQAAGYRLGIITRNSSAAVARIIGKTVLPVEEILCREDVRRPKPHPEHVLEMLCRLGSTPARAAMVGDHPMDIETGKAAAMLTVGVLTGQTGAEVLRAASPDLLFPSVVALAEAMLADGLPPGQV